MAAHRPDSPCQATISANHGSSALAKLTMAKVRPSMQATSIAASAMPTTGKVEQLARAAQAGIAERGDDGRIELPRRSASISSMTALPIAASARVAM